MLQWTLLKQYGCLKLIHFQKKSGRLSSTGSEILAFGSHCSANFQPILDCFIPKFKLKYGNLENIKTDCVDTVIFNLHQIKQSKFFLGHPVLYCIVLYRIVSYRIVSYRIVSYRIVSYRIVSYRIVLYRIVSYRIVSYCIVSYWRQRSCLCFTYLIKWFYHFTRFSSAMFVQISFKFSVTVISLSYDIHSAFQN